MTSASLDLDAGRPLTSSIAELGRSVTYDVLPTHALRRAKHSFLDTLGVMLAGAKSEPARIVRRIVVGNQTSGAATIMGAGYGKARPIDATLANGVAAHALDFDDTGGGEIGHASAPVVSAAIAVGELTNASGADLLTAMVAGYEVGARVAAVMGIDHYESGFHSTSTYGCFTTAAVGAHLLELERDQWVMALGLAGTQAAGLRANIGTMSKPLHSGRAASIGVLSSLLAREGFTGSADIVGAKNGFAWTQTPRSHPDEAFRPLGVPYVTDNMQYKYHSACLGTHSTIDGIKRLRGEHEFDANEVQAINLRVPAYLLDICNIAQPKTGLECKFSFRFTAAASILGWHTTESGFSTELASDPRAIAIMERVSVKDAQLPTRRGPTEIEVVLSDGRRLTTSQNSIGVQTDLDMEWNALVVKFTEVTEGILGEQTAAQVAERIANFNDEKSVRSFVNTLSGSSSN